MNQTAASLSKYQFQVSVLVPMYNEESTIVFVLNKIKLALKDRSYEVIVVDDGSKDSSAIQVQTFIKQNPQLHLRYIHQANTGKGGAIRTAIEHSQGEILVVQDADLEYEPSDILPLLKPFQNGAKVVYGSRNMNKVDREHSSLLFYWGGIAVTIATNILYGCKLTDEATGYKLFHASLFEDLSFHYNDFAWEPEITAKILKRKIQIHELPITYKPRSKDEGKKITWQDGIKAVWVLCKERFKN